MSIGIKILTLMLVFNLYAKDRLPTQSVPMCRADLNNDKKDDFIFLALGWQVFAILSNGKQYNLHLARGLTGSKANQLAILSCHKGSHIFETPAGLGTRKKRKVKINNGTYFKVSWPESSSVVYFWDGSVFKEIWTSD